MSPYTSNPCAKTGGQTPAYLRIQAENMAVEGYLTLILVFRPPHRFPYNMDPPSLRTASLIMTSQDARGYFSPQRRTEVIYEEDRTLGKEILSSPSPNFRIGIFLEKNSLRQDGIFVRILGVSLATFLTSPYRTLSALSVSPSVKRCVLGGLGDFDLQTAAGGREGKGGDFLAFI